MKLGDFIKQEDVKKTSSYKVVVGDSPKEQELQKEASKVESLSQNLQDLQIRYDNIFNENEFFKKQVTRHQNDLDITKGKLEDQTNLQKDLINKENSMTLLKEEIHELSILKHNNKEKIKDLSIQLNDKTGEAERFERELDITMKAKEKITSNYNGLSSENNSIKDFSEKIQNDYNKVRERNTVLINEREKLSKLKTEFEVKSIRLGEELNKNQKKLKNLNERLTKVESKNVITDAEIVKKNNFADKLQENFKTIYKSKNDLETKLIESRKDVKDLSKMAYIYKDKLMKEKQESINWNIAKQELKFGQGETYPNKLGFGSNPLFKLPKEK
jgi:chromosome segregation ATPase